MTQQVKAIDEMVGYRGRFWAVSLVKGAPTTQPGVKMMSGYSGLPLSGKSSDPPNLFSSGYKDENANVSVIQTFNTVRSSSRATKVILRTKAA